MADRKRIFKIALTAVAIAGLIGIALVFWQFRRGQGPALPIPEVAGKALMTLAKVHQTATKDGRVQWELDAESAQLEAGGKRMVLEAPRVVFFMEDGGMVHLTAQKGVLDTKNNDMNVTGNVRLTNDRYTLETEALSYQHHKRVLRSTVPVKITSEHFDLRANKMMYNIDDDLAQFDGQVEGNLNDDLAL